MLVGPKPLELLAMSHECLNPLPLLRCCDCKRHLPAVCFHKATQKRDKRQYTYNCRECKNEWARNRPQHLKDRKARQSKEWRLRNPHRQAFNNQRCNAKKRGIEWDFSFESWMEWWGPDIERRGCRSGNLVMARQGDVGAYTPANVYKEECGANARAAVVRSR